MISTPAGTDPIRDVRWNATFLPIEVGEGNGDDHFWLISFRKEWHEGGTNHTGHELRLRCRHCDFGYNSGPYITIRNLVRMGQEAVYHVDACPHTGRTLELLSPDTGSRLTNGPATKRPTQIEA